MKLIGSIDLPEHVAQGGFDHAAVHAGTSGLYVAHTSNDAIDVIDCVADRFKCSIPNLTGVAGALVSEERGLVFTSNRGENSVGMFEVGDEEHVAKVKVGIRPNGLSFDPSRGLLLVANVGDPAIPGSLTLSVVDVLQQKMIQSIPVEGRTRWTVFDPQNGVFYVNIADPAQIDVVDAAEPAHVSRSLGVPANGPHGIDLDPASNRLFCACDAGKLFALDASSGKVLHEADLSGVPDVIFFNPGLHHLYVAVGDPGVIDVFDANDLSQLETVDTERGAHTIALDLARSKVYAFLPHTHRAAVYSDEI